MKVGFIGCGNMGGALAAAAAKSGEEIFTADHHPEKLSALARSCGTIPSTAEEIARECTLIFLGVKPQALHTAAGEIRPLLSARKDHFAVVSMAAGVSGDDVSQALGGCPVLRIMPNTPAAVGEGILLYSPGPGVTEEDVSAFLRLMKEAGTAVSIGEDKIDIAGTVSGCGPAFVYLFLEGLIDGGVRCGLSRAQAAALALQTAAGAAKLALATGKDPAVLRGEVCSPAGSTIEGIAALEARGVRFAALEAISAAAKRAAELGKR